jgi:glycosyltransferase involved in cell wall biosynthesis
MRILQIHNFYRQPGGEDTVIENEARLLMRRGHEVHRYVLHNDAIVEMGKLAVARCVLWNSAAYAAVRRAINQRGIDLVHAHNTFPLVSPAVYYAAAAEDVPVVQTLHNYRLLCPAATFFRDGHVCEDCLNRTLPWPAIVHRCYRHDRTASAASALMLLCHRIAGTCSNRVSAYIAISEFARKKFVEGGIPNAKLHVKPNFLLDEPVVGSGVGHYALFAGRLAPEKGILTLLEAWRLLQIDVPLRIAGDGLLRTKVEKAISSLSNVTYLGQCSRRQVLELMRNAALFILPSEWYECPPMTLIESVACGTPVLSSECGSLRETIEPGVNGHLFTPGDPGALAASIEKLFKNQDYLGEIRYSTRQYYETHFGAEANYLTLLRIYENVQGSS